MVRMDKSMTDVVWRDCHRADADAIALDDGGRLDKHSILEALAGHFGFPGYFGFNWDAAYDLLLDELQPDKGELLWRFSLRAGSGINQTDLESWCQLMDDLCAYARSRGRKLQIEMQRELA